MRWIHGRGGPLRSAVRGLALAALLGSLGLPAVTAVAQDATPPPPQAYAPGTDLATLQGRIIVDGSSTVWPISAEAAQRFRDLAPVVHLDIEVSGTSGGFRRFCFGASDVQDASRPITDAEAAECAANDVAYHALEVGYDGITVVVNPQSTFVDCLSVDQLRRLWAPGSTVRTWHDLDPSWPTEPIVLYGPGPDSGTFDYFTEAVVGEVDASRTDYTASEDDHLLVQEVAERPFALGYFGYAYYVEAQDRLKALAVDAGHGCVAPSPRTITDGTYAPLSRLLYVYVSDRSLARPEVQEFLRFYAATAPSLVAEVGYVPAGSEVYAANQATLEQAIAEAQAVAAE